MKTVKAQKAVEEPVVPPQDPAADAGADGSLIKKDQVIDLIQKARGVQSFTVKEVSGKGAIITVETLPAQPAIMRSPEAQAAGRQQEVGQQPAEMAAAAKSSKVHVKIALSDEGIKKAVAGRYPSAFLKAMGMR